MVLFAVSTTLGALGLKWIDGEKVSVCAAPLPVEVFAPSKDHPYVSFRYANGVRLYSGGTWGGGSMSFKGTLGEVPDRRYPRTAPPAITIPNYKGHGGIFGDFLHCVKTRERPFRDIELAHRTVATCHLANIAFWCGRRFKFDPVKEEFVGDDAANRMRRRPARAASPRSRTSCCCRRSTALSRSSPM